MPPRRSRGGARVSRASRRISTSVVKPPDESDEEMQDAEVEDTLVANTQNEDEVATPGQDSEAQAEEDDDEHASSPPVVQSIPRRRRGPGRPRLSRPGAGNSDLGGDDDDDSGTPGRRRRGGFRGGFRGRPKYGPSAQATRVPVDKEGNMLDVVDDEVALPEDAEGETKVDKDGHLADGRDYRVRVFPIKARGNRLYMLSTEPARCTGFRDSYLFFTKHLTLFKIILGDEEKKDLIAREVIPHSYKGRSIGVVTARSVFREFGARIVIGGKKIVDDYRVQEARERGDFEGDLADPQDRLPAPGEPYNKNQYVAWHGASQVYHSNAPTVPVPTGRPVVGKRKNNVTAVNWQFEHAREASRFNTTLTSLRRANLDGVYDVHTNLMLYPKIMQPSHAKWERVTSESSTDISIADQHLLTNGENNDDQPTTTDSTPLTLFPNVPAVISRNFLVTDTICQSSALPTAQLPGPDGTVSDLGSNGLDGIPRDLLDELPEECRLAFEAELSREMEWKNRWRDEKVDSLRGNLRIGFNGFPV